MPTIRYEVTLPPAAQRDPTAFAPIPVNSTARYANRLAQGWTQHGQPGTQPIPAPYSGVNHGIANAAPGSMLPGGSGGAGAGGSRYMPPSWNPSLYWARQDLWGAIGGVQVYSNNEPPLPSVPSADPRWVPGKYRRTWPWMNDRPVQMPPVTPFWKRWRAHDAPEAQTGRRPTDG